MSLPLLGLLSAAGGSRLAVLAPKYTARVFWGIDGVDELVVFSRGGVFRRLRSRARLLRRLDASAVIILPPSFSSAVPPFLARIPVRIGYRMDGRSFLLSVSVPARALRDEHVSDNYIRLGRIALGRLGLPENTSFAVPKLRVFPNERFSIERKLREKKGPQSGFCLIIPGSAYGPAKSWPEPSYKEAVRLLSSVLPVVLAGSPSDRKMNARIAGDIPGVFDMTGETTIGEFFALIERAEVLIANDSGAPHAAGSLGTPVVVIFGSTSPLWTAPLGEDISVVREPTLCAPCFLRECPTNLECFERIEPETVVDLAVRLAKKEVDISPGEG